MNRLIANVIGLLSSISAQTEAVAEQSAPTYLYKVVSPEQWEESQEAGHIVPSPMDQEFFHLAKEDQVDYVVNKFWKGKKHIVLKIKTSELTGDLKYETNPGGSTKYYHLYNGIIPLDAVIDVSN